MSEKHNEENKNFKMVVPDGGFGYWICLSFIIIMSTQTMFAGCFGLLFDEFINEIGMNSTAITFLTGVNALCFAASGFFTDSILKLMSKRQLAMIGILLFNISAIGTVFMKTNYHFLLVQGILPGISLGLNLNICSTILNDYFEKKRLFAFSLVQTFVAVNGMIAPLFVKWSLQNFGFRGTLLFIAGISLQSVIGGLLMQPVTWHMKKVEVTPATPKKPIHNKEEKPLLTPTIQLTDEEIGVSKDLLTASPVDKEQKSFFIKVVETFVDVAFFKKFILSCPCLGLALSNFSEFTYILILPQALYTIGWNQSNVALAISLYGFGDLAARVLLIFTSNFLLKIGSQQLYIIGLIIACVSRFGVLWSHSQIIIYIFLVIMGIARCFICVLINMVISDTVKPEKFTQGMGMFMLMTGLVMVTFGPIIGAIRDLTDSYSTTFYFLSSLYAIISLFWTIELFYKRNKHKRVALSKSKNNLVKGK